MNQPTHDSRSMILPLFLALFGASVIVLGCLSLPVFRTVSPYPLVIGVILALVFLAGAFCLFRLSSLSALDLQFLLTLLGLLILIRGCLLYYQSGDHYYFLDPWVKALREAPGFSGLSTRLGDYNMPYLYLLFAIAKLANPAMDLFWIKFVSMMFDVLLAYYAMKLVSLKTSRPRVLACSFLAVFAIPTVILNSAMWAQCDSIYAAFTLAAIYHAIKKNSKLAYFFLGVAFSFKMQTIFVFPLFLVFLLQENIRLKDAYVFVATIFAFLAPVLLLGMPFKDALSVYLEQANAYPQLTANAINLYQLVLSVEFRYFNLLAILLAGAAVLALLYVVFLYRKQLTEPKEWIHLAFLFVVIIPFLLPRMHDRYFFLADVLSLVVFLYDRKKWYLPLITIFCSYVTYANFLMGFEQLFSFRHLAVLLLITILLSLKEFIETLQQKKESHQNGEIPSMVFPTTSSTGTS